jgi:colicin import membrane protein
MSEQITSKPWYKKWWGILLIIALFPLLVPYLVWAKTNWHKGIKIAITLFCIFFVVSNYYNDKKQEKEILEKQTEEIKQVENIVEQAESYIRENKIEEALAVLDKTKELDAHTNKDAAVALRTKINEFQNPHYFKRDLTEMSDIDFDLLQKGELKTSFINHEELNKLFLAKLQENANQRAIYIAEAEELKKKAQEEEQKEVEKKKKAQEEAEKKQNETLSQKNAIRKAESYLDFSGFSKTGLIKQLEFEGVPHEDAVYAVDNVGADWNEQAEKKAKSYQDYSGFSRAGLIKQLKFEGFTTEQATYGVDALGL